MMAKPNVTERLGWTPQEIADAYKLSKNFVLDAIRRGDLPATRFSRKTLRVSEQHVREWTQARETRAAVPAA